MCDGSQARMSLELANAIISSSRSGRPVKLPLNRAKYTKLLQKLIAGSNAKTVRCEFSKFPVLRSMRRNNLPLPLYHVVQ